MNLPQCGTINLRLAHQVVVITISKPEHFIFYELFTLPGQSDWRPTSAREIAVFFGIILQMGFHQGSSIEDYWSEGQKGTEYMGRNRFQLLLSTIRFSNPRTAERNKDEDRLAEIRSLVRRLNKRFQSVRSPLRCLVIDESLMSYRGKIVFKQFMKGKRHKYGIKIFRLCDATGYCYRFEVYAGKTRREENVTSKLCLRLMRPSFLDNGHVLFVDNYFTSYDLARKLWARKTHLVGTLRRNRKDNPRELLNQRMKQGDYAAASDGEGVLVLRFFDKREVVILTTFHNTKKQLHLSQRTRQPRLLPKAFIDYDFCKCGVDKSDQMASYHSALRKTKRWELKLAVELLLNSAVVNTWCLLRKMPSSMDISIKDVRKEISNCLMQS